MVISYSNSGSSCSVEQATPDVAHTTSNKLLGLIVKGMASLRLLEARRTGGVTATPTPPANAGLAENGRAGGPRRVCSQVRLTPRELGSERRCEIRAGRTLRALPERPRQSTSVGSHRDPSRFVSESDQRSVSNR